MHHRERFTDLVMDRTGARAARRLDWSTPRVLIITEVIGPREEAGGSQIAGHVELFAMCRVAGGLVVLQTPRLKSQLATGSSAAGEPVP
jgi:hypothetical protein